MAEHAGMNMEGVRRSNRAAVLKYINDHGPASRKDLARALGLTPAALTQICTGLLATGELMERGSVTESRRVGRRQILLDLDYNAAHVYAVNIEPKYTTIALCNLKGEAVEQCRFPTDSEMTPSAFLEKIAEKCRGMYSRHTDDVNKMAAVSVGITGLVDREHGISQRAYGIWEEAVPLGELLGNMLKLPVFVENNVNAFAMAELLYGWGREYENLMIIKWGPGVGCAMIIDRKIYEGRHSKAAELGHFIVDRNGKRCSCGRRGCLETKVSYQALQKIRPFGEADFSRVYEESKADNKQREFDDAIRLFAQSIVNSATIMAPNRIVLAGELFRGENIRRLLIEACESLDASFGNGRILYSELASKESYIGPAAVGVHRILF